MSEEKNDKPTPVTIRILGKDYVVACPEGAQPSLISSAKQVDETMREIRRSGKIIGSERIAVITALNLAHELNFAKDKVSSVDDDIVKRIDILQQRVSTTLKRIKEVSSH